MWNYMGWDNASTVARDVENPQRTYPRAMIASTALVAFSYILPLAAMAIAGLSVHTFSTGDWTTAAEALGGPALGVAIVAGGAISGIGMFNALVMSYTRLPMAMAEDGMLPSFVASRNRHGVPWVSVLFCGVAWALALKLPFERLISIDLILYGSSLLLEFVALAALRLREPELGRPFKAGSFPVACLLGVGPAVLISYALYVSRNEKLLESGAQLGGDFGNWLSSVPALVFALFVGMLGPLLYWMTAALSRPGGTEPVS
jgi:amino acid transporter